MGNRDGDGQETRGNRVYRVLVERIRTGILSSGARLREEDLASSLGVSRTPVREAFARLLERGLVQPGAGGLTVASLSRRQVIELYAVRARLEGMAAAFATENASSGELAGFAHVASLFEAQRADAKSAARANILLHEAIYEAAHNRYLRRMLDDLNDSLALLPDTTFSVPGRGEAALIEHKAILDAIMRRDVTGAEAAARTHIEMALQARLTLLFAIDRAT
jgi:DNA-binding GntR family transcriptional regulator